MGGMPAQNKPDNAAHAKWLKDTANWHIAAGNKHLMLGKKLMEAHEAYEVLGLENGDIAQTVVSNGSSRPQAASAQTESGMWKRADLFVEVLKTVGELKRATEIMELAQQRGGAVSRVDTVSTYMRADKRFYRLGMKWGLTEWKKPE